MSETRALLRAAAAARREGQAGLLATVVRVRGSSYRRPGARMLLGGERWLAGSVSGGCLEADVMRRGWWRTRGGAPVVVTYDATADDDVRWGLGLGCDGVVDVLLERLDAGTGGVDALRFLDDCQRRQRRGVLATVFDARPAGVPPGSRLALAADGSYEAHGIPDALRTPLVAACALTLAEGFAPALRTVEWPGGEVQTLVEPVLPAPRLFVLGSGHDALPVVQLGVAVGWEVLVCDPHAGFATRDRFAAADDVVTAPLHEVGARIDASDRPLAVVMGHHYERDRDALRMLLASRARYIGVLGPRRRTARMLLELTGRDSLVDDRVHAPVGLELGAESPAEIALAIVAEVQSVLTRAAASSLRLRPGPIHAGTAE